VGPQKIPAKSGFLNFRLLEILNNRYKTAKQKPIDRNKNNVELISKLYEELFDAMMTQTENELVA